MKQTNIIVFTAILCVIMLFSLSSFALADGEGDPTGNTTSLISSRTEDLVLCEGCSTVLEVTASDEITTYNWEVSTDGEVNWDEAPRATNASTYSITDAQKNTPEQQPYKYRVTVTAASGQTDSAIFSVLVSDDYTYKTISLRDFDVEVTGYMHNQTRLVAKALSDDSAEKIALNHELHLDCLPLIACNLSLTNRNDQVVPNFGSLEVEFKVGEAYEEQTLKVHQLIGNRVNTYSGVVSNGILGINVDTLSQFMVEVPESSTKTITVSAGNGGSVTPSGVVNVVSGADKTFTFLPDEGYAINEVSVDGVPVDFMGNSYTLSPINESHTVNVCFRQVPKSDVFHTITIESGAHGSVSPANTIQVRHGYAQTFYFYPDSKYELDKVWINGVVVSVVGNSYTISAVESDTTIQASFHPAATQLPDIQKTVSSSAGSNGSIYPSGDARIEYGGGMYYYFVPDAGYVLDQVTIDGAAVSVTDNCYYFDGVTADHIINVTFKKSPLPSPSYSAPIYNVTISSGESRVKASATVSNGTATISVSSQLDNMLSNAGTSGNINFDVRLSKGIDTVQIPAQVVRKMAKAAGSTDSSITGLSVTADTGTVELDAKALAVAGEQAAGSTVSIHVDRIRADGLNSTQRGALTGDHADDQIVEVTVKSDNTFISKYDGGKITVTVPYELKAGETVHGVRTWHLASDGSLMLIECLYDEATKTISFVTDQLPEFVVGCDKIAAWENHFMDVAKRDWFYADVAYASIAGFMEGISRTAFAPNVNTSRAMIVTILWRLENKPTMDAGKNLTFTDVPEGEWYTEAVEWAAANGIVEGFGDNSFRPTMNISREQLAVILWRYAKYMKYDVSVSEDTNILSYADAESISKYAVPAMHWCCGTGLLQGDGEMLMPSGKVTRAQAAAILHRLSEQRTNG